MHDLVPFLLAFRKLDPTLTVEVGLDERFQHMRDLSEADARLMARVCLRGAQTGMLVALDESDMQLPPEKRAAEVHRVYLLMLAPSVPQDAAQAAVPNTSFDSSSHRPLELDLEPDASSRRLRRETPTIIERNESTS